MSKIPTSGKVFKGSTAARSRGHLTTVGTKPGEDVAGRRGKKSPPGETGRAKKVSSEKAGKRQGKLNDDAKSIKSFSSQNGDLSARHEKFDSMLKGDLHNLPVLPKSTVRIFLSSTFTDTSVERNKLTTEVYPMLKEHCSNADLDFQVVDMRWGVTQDSQNDHSVERLCLNEIDQCQRHSLGPNFVCILGDKYGYQPIPIDLSVDLYEMIRGETDRLNHPKRHLLTQWYRCDHNADPPVYKLQPIRTHFPHFGDRNRGNEDVSSRDSLAWSETYAGLRAMLRSNADLLLRDGRIDEICHHQFYWSVTEQEVGAGILGAAEPELHALCFHRTILGLRDDVGDRAASGYINTDPALQEPNIDEGASKNLKQLATNRIPKILRAANRVELSVTWKPGGLNPNVHIDHAEYVDKFCAAFVEKVTALIDRAVRAKEDYIKQTEYYSSPDEIVHHLKFCEAKTEAFCGQVEILEKIRDYVTNSRRTPFVIHAESGAGKTSVMAMAMKMLKAWFKSTRYIGVVRFLGTSPDSGNLYDVLFSVCGQLADVYGLIMEPVCYQNVKTLVEYLPRFLRRVGSAAKIPVVILLDSIDQLKSAGGAYLMKWLPLFLPSNVKIVVSVLSHEGDILRNMKALQKDDGCFAEVPLLRDSAVVQIVNAQLKIKRRKLTKQQMSLIVSKYQTSQNPLFLKLLIDRALLWSSYDIPTESDLRDTTKLAIAHLFDDLEVKYGSRLIEAALGYITVSLNGLSETEIEDVLSTDDGVLDEVYVYHDPPVAGVVRIPSLLWARVHHDLKPYLAERLSHGKPTMFWYHRRFIEAATEKYANDVAVRCRLHANLLSIYVHEQGLKRDVYLKHRELMCPMADRQITHQPLTVKNRRKLSCVTHHLQNAGSVVSASDAKRIALCNFGFLFAKVASMSVNSLLRELEAYSQSREPDDETTTVINFLGSLTAKIHHETEFAVQLLANVADNSKYPFIHELLEQAKLRVHNSEQPLLVPAGPCFGSTSRLFRQNLLLYNATGCRRISAVDTNVCYVDEGTGGRGVYAVTDCLSGDATHLAIDTEIYDEVQSGGNKLCFSSQFGYIIYNADTCATQCCQFENIPEIKNIVGSGEIIRKYVTEDCELMTMATRTSVFVVNLSDRSVVSTFELEAGFTLTNVGCNSTFMCVFGNITDRAKIFIQDFSSNVVESYDTRFSVENCEIIVTELGKIISLWCKEASFEIMIYDKSLESQYKFSFNGKFSHYDGEKFGFISADNVSVFDALNKGMINIHVNNDVAKSMAIVASRNWVVVGYQSGILAVYDSSSAAFLLEIDNCKHAVEQCVTSDRFVVSRVENAEMRVWEVTKLQAVIESESASVPIKSIFTEIETSAACVSRRKRELFTATLDRKLRVWSLDTYRLVRQFPSDYEASSLDSGENDVIVAYSRKSERIELCHSETGRVTWCELPEGVLGYCLSRDKSVIFVVSHVGMKLLITEVDTTQKRIVRQLGVQKGLGFDRIDCCLSLNGRYLVLQARCTDDDKKSIAAALKKGGFLSQPHPYRFSAVDLSRDTGILHHCYRQLTKIPSLGVCVAPYRDDTMMFTARRSVVFWDIASGKCDQKMSKSAKSIMMYRPDWTGGDKCVGVSDCLVQSENCGSTVLGSDDGYVIIYDSETGVPLNSRAPDTKHDGVVNRVAVSPDNRWLVTSCTDCDLKLWDVTSGHELFSMRLFDQIGSIQFSADSRNVVVLVGKFVHRVLVFVVHPGHRDEKDGIDHYR